MHLPEFTGGTLGRPDLRRCQYVLPDHSRCGRLPEWVAWDRPPIKMGVGLCELCCRRFRSFSYDHAYRWARLF